MVTRNPAELDFVAGDPALDFANTVGGARGVEPDEEFLADYGDLAAWSAYAGVLDEPTATRLTAAARRRPDAAEDAYGRARRLRSAIVGVFQGVAEAEEPDAAALSELAAVHAEALGRARLVPTPDGFDFAWDDDELDRITWPLALAAVDLLRAGPLDRLKICHDCCWMFLDVSRNRSRRWCSMNHCGGRRKMQRYRERRRATEGR